MIDTRGVDHQRRGWRQWTLESAHAGNDHTAVGPPYPRQLETSSSNLPTKSPQSESCQDCPAFWETDVYSNSPRRRATSSWATRRFSCTADMILLSKVTPLILSQNLGGRMMEQ